jgi:hypothetical protein
VIERGQGDPEGRAREEEHTDEKNQSIRRRLAGGGTLEREQAHAGNDGTDKIDVEYGVYVY